MPGKEDMRLWEDGEKDGRSFGGPDVETSSARAGEWNLPKGPE